VYPLSLCEIMRDLVMLRCFGYASYESMWDYAGFGYASLLFRLCILWVYVRLCGIWLCLFVVSVMHPLSLCEIMRDLVMHRCFGYASYESMWDYAGFGYASLLFRLCILWVYVRLCGIWLCLFVVSVMHPLSLCEIMRDLVMPLCCFCYVSLGLVMFRLSLLFRLCSYSWLCIVYYIHDTILYKGYCLWFDLLLLIDTPCHRPVMLYILDGDRSLWRR